MKVRFLPRAPLRSLDKLESFAAQAPERIHTWWYFVKSEVMTFCPCSLMDRTRASEARDAGPIPAKGTTSRLI